MRAPDQAFDLAGGSMPWPPDLLDRWHGCARLAADLQVFDRRLLSGDPLLRELIAGRCGRSPAAVTITPSARLTAYGLARERRRAVIERPTYGGVPKAMRRAGAEVEMRDWEDMEMPTGVPAGLAWVTSPLRNPDGRSLSPVDGERLRRLAERGWLVVQNVTYAAFDSEPWTPVPGVALAGTFNKVLGRGFGLAWLCSDVPAAELGHLLSAGRPPAAWQRALALFIQEGGWDEMERLVVDRVLAARDAFLAALGAGAGGSRGPFVLQAQTGAAARDALLAALRERGIRARPDPDFELGGAAIRYSFFGVDRDQAGECGRAVRECCERLGMTATVLHSPVPETVPGGGAECPTC